MWWLSSTLSICNRFDQQKHVSLRIELGLDATLVQLNPAAARTAKNLRKNTEFTSSIPSTLVNSVKKELISLFFARTLAVTTKIGSLHVFVFRAVAAVLSGNGGFDAGGPSTQAVGIFGISCGAVVYFLLALASLAATSAFLSSISSSSASNPVGAI